MDCPRCNIALEDARASEHVCLRCRGRLLEPGVAEREFDRHVRLSKAELLELANAFGGARIPCGHCGQQMRPLTLRSVPLDLCFGCGAVWLDDGELARLTGDADREPPLPAPPEPSPTNDSSSEPLITEPLASVVLAADEAPPFDALTAAFLTVGRTSIDARQWQRRNSGVLVESVPPEAAARFRAALGTYGDRVAVLDAAQLSPLPQFDAPRIQIAEGGITLYDHLDRGGFIAFDAIRAVAVAQLKVEKRSSKLIEKRVPRARGPDRVVLRHEVQEESSSSILLALVAGGYRVRVTSDRLPGFSSSERPRALRAIAQQIVAQVDPRAVHPATRVALEANQRLPSVPSLQRLDVDLAVARLEDLPVTAPRLRFVRSLAIASDDDAAVLLAGLGAAATADTDAWTLGDGAVLVVPTSAAAPTGFIPLFVTDDLQRACDHYVGEGLTVRDLPWDARARAVLVGKGEAWICVATATALYDSPLLDD